MPEMDKEMAQRVWQRVSGRGSEGDPASRLQTLISGELEDAAVYLYLSRQFKGNESAVLRRLYQQEQSHVACLKGMYDLLTGRQPLLRTMPVKPMPPADLLRQCYGREMRSLQRYESFSGDPDYGRIFSAMAEQERAHCGTVLELLGRLRSK